MNAPPRPDRPRSFTEQVARSAAVPPRYLSRCLCLCLALSTAWPDAALAAPVAVTPEEQKEMTELSAKEVALQKELDAVKARIKVISDNITKRESPHLPGESLPVPALPGDDKLAASFAKFRSEYNLMVRQSVFTKSGKEEPALFQYTMPAQGNDSWLADVGIGLSHDFKPEGGGHVLGRPAWKLLADYHYNEALGALKDSFTGAAGVDFEFGNSTAMAQKVSLEAGYKRDNLLSGEGITGNLTWYPSFPGVAGDFKRVNAFMNGRIVPYVGVETESGDGLLKNFKDGERWSAVAGLTLAAELFPGWLGNRLEASVTYAYWNHFTTSGGYDAYDDNQAYFSGLITYWLDRGKTDPGTHEPGKVLSKDDKHFGLSVKYVNGDNPGTGEFDADVWTFGLSIKF